MSRIFDRGIDPALPAGQRDSIGREQSRLSRNAVLGPRFLIPIACPLTPAFKPTKAYRHALAIIAYWATIRL